MLYPLSYRRKARVVYRGEAGVATGAGTPLCAGSVEWGGGTTYHAAVRNRAGLTGWADCMHIFLPVR
jgi:hypothetical protein